MQRPTRNPPAIFSQWVEITPKAFADYQYTRAGDEICLTNVIPMFYGEDVSVTLDLDMRNPRVKITSTENAPGAAAVDYLIEFFALLDHASNEIGYGRAQPLNSYTLNSSDAREMVRNLLDTLYPFLELGMRARATDYLCSNSSINHIFGLEQARDMERAKVESWLRGNHEMPEDPYHESSDDSAVESLAPMEDPELANVGDSDHESPKEGQGNPDES